MDFLFKRHIEDDPKPPVIYLGFNIKFCSGIPSANYLTCFNPIRHNSRQIDSDSLLQSRQSAMFQRLIVLLWLKLIGSWATYSECTVLGCLVDISVYHTKISFYNCNWNITKINPNWWFIQIMQLHNSSFAATGLGKRDVCWSARCVGPGPDLHVTYKMLGHQNVPTNN